MSESKPVAWRAWAKDVPGKKWPANQWVYWDEEEPTTIQDDPEFEKFQALYASPPSQQTVDMDGSGPKLHPETYAKEIDAWKDSAAFHCRNEMFYRGLIVQIGEMFGKEAYISDDGSVQQDVLALKVPELVAALFRKHLVSPREGWVKLDDVTDVIRRMDDCSAGYIADNLESMLSASPPLAPTVGEK